jgi:predicted Mrr-cat superfamily restriction endonuclease
MSIFKPRPILGIFFVIFLVVFCGTFHVAAQAVECPAGKVCISVEQARQALLDADAVKALTAENAVLKQANVDHVKLEADLKIEMARIMGEKTGADQMVVRLTAVVDILLKNVRPKKIGLINF